MRFLLIVVLTTSFNLGSKAQELPGIKIDTLRKAKISKPDFLSQHTIIGKNALGTVYKLRQDNMLCLVPDTTGLCRIPNASNRSFLFAVNSIPNGYPNRKVTVK
jgi:hypothetical protein